MKDKYTYSEVLFGAREEYEKIRGKLKRLAELTKVKKKRQVLGVEYRPFIYGEQIDCEYKQNPYTLKGIEDSLREKYQYYPNYKFETVIRGYDDNHYHLTNNSKYGLFISEENREEFDKLIYEVLASDFKYTIRESITSNLPLNKIKLYDNRISAYMPLRKGAIDMRYFYSKDNVEFARLPIKGLGCIEEEIMMLLNQTIDSEQLGEKFCSIIDNSASAHKNIIITSELNPKINPVTFDILEKENEMALVKTLNGKRN